MDAYGMVGGGKRDELNETFVLEYPRGNSLSSRYIRSTLPQSMSLAYCGDFS